MLALNLYSLISGQSVHRNNLTEHTFFMRHMEVEVQWTLYGTYSPVFYCQIKENSRQAAERGTFLSCGPHIPRSTSLGFSTVDVVFAFRCGII